MRAKFKLRAYWSKREKDLMIDWPLGISTGADGWLLHEMFSKDFQKELIERGYDIETIRFEIAIKPGSCPERFPTLHKDLNK